MENWSADWRRGLQVVTRLGYVAPVQLYPVLNKADWATDWLRSVDSIRKMVITLASGTQLSWHPWRRYITWIKLWLAEGGMLSMEVVIWILVLMKIRAGNQVNQWHIVMWTHEPPPRDGKHSCASQIQFRLNSYLLTDELLPKSGMNATPWKERSLNGTTFVSLIHFLWHKTVKKPGLSRVGPRSHQKRLCSRLDITETTYCFYANRPSARIKPVNPLTETASFWNCSPERCRAPSTRSWVTKYAAFNQF